MLGHRAVLALLAAGWLVLLTGLIVDMRRGGPEAVIRSYLVDLESRHLEAAQSVLTPEASRRWSDFVAFQQFNRYRVVSLAVRSASLLEIAASGKPWRATQATLVADVLEPSGVQWRGSTIVPVDFVEGRWLIERPPFAPE